MKNSLCQMRNHLTSDWIIHIDDNLLVINKPAGILSIADGYNPDLPYLRTILEPEFGRLYIVHRLDKDTSGVMVIARNEQSHNALNQQFDQRKTRKEYRALVLGSPPWKNLLVELPITVNGDKAHRTRVFPNRGKAAQTDLRQIQSWMLTAYLSVTPHTGYTHQIRAHCSAIGYPVLFDTLYTPPDKKELAYLFTRQLGAAPSLHRTMLHAYEIRISHPETGEMITYQAPIPHDMESILEILNK